jgi:hypothetical protein
VHGVVPANECFDAGDVRGLRVDLGLVVHRQLAGCNHLAQFLQGAQPVLAAERVIRLAVDAEAGAQVLGVVHRDIGSAQQGRDFETVLGEERDTDTRSHPHGDAVDRERSEQCLADHLGEHLGAAAVDVQDEDRELVAAEAGEQAIFVGQSVCESSGDLQQEVVASVVAE